MANDDEFELRIRIPKKYMLMGYHIVTAMAKYEAGLKLICTWPEVWHRIVAQIEDQMEALCDAEQARET